jgi:hypothetical protein
VEASHVFFDAKVLIGTPNVHQTQMLGRLVGYNVDGKSYWVATGRFDISAAQGSIDIQHGNGMCQVDLQQLSSELMCCSVAHRYQLPDN